MDLEKKTKTELIDKILQLEKNLEMATIGIREKDRIIQSKETQVHVLEEQMNNFTTTAKQVVQSEVSKVHDSYRSLVEQTKHMQSDGEQLTRGILAFNGLVDDLLAIKIAQDNSITNMIKNIKDNFLIEEKEGK